MPKNALVTTSDDRNLFNPYPRIGRCIYCRTTEPPLTDEHIFPYSLGGKWQLREATCDECAKITGLIEWGVSRGMLLATRTALNVATRNKKKRPTRLPIRVDRGSGLEEILVPPEDHPAIVVLPQFPSPAYLSGAKFEKGISFGEAFPMSGGRLSSTEFAQKYGARKIEFENTYKPTDFARMLAKIAYAYSVGRFGLSAFEKVYVVPAILGRSEDVGMWVGCTTEHSLTPGAEHSIRTDLVGEDLVAYIRLFGDRVPIEYVVVVGRPATSASPGNVPNSDEQRGGRFWPVKMANRLTKTIKRYAQWWRGVTR